MSDLAPRPRLERGTYRLGVLFEYSHRCCNAGVPWFPCRGGAVRCPRVSSRSGTRLARTASLSGISGGELTLLTSSITWALVSATVRPSLPESAAVVTHLVTRSGRSHLNGRATSVATIDQSAIPSVRPQLLPSPAQQRSASSLWHFPSSRLIADCPLTRSSHDRSRTAASLATASLVVGWVRLGSGCLGPVLPHSWHGPVKCWAVCAQSEGRDVGALLTEAISNSLVLKGEGWCPPHPLPSGERLALTSLSVSSPWWPGPIAAAAGFAVCGVVADARHG